MIKYAIRNIDSKHFMLPDAEAYIEDIEQAFLYDRKEWAQNDCTEFEEVAEIVITRSVKE
jgi:hypothetical protein